MGKDQRNKNQAQQKPTPFTGNQANANMNNENANQEQSNQDAVNGGAAGSAQDQSGTGTIQSGGSNGGEQGGVQSSAGAGEAGQGTAVGDQGAPAAPAAGELNTTITHVASRAVGDQIFDIHAITTQPSQKATEEAADALIVELDKELAPEHAVGFTDGPSISQHATGLLETFHAYVDRMNPRTPTTSAEGATQQRRLFRALQSIINQLDGVDFQVAFGTVLTTIEAHAETVFADLNAYRFLDAPELVLQSQERLAFRNLLNFLLKIAPTVSRHLVAKQVNMDATFGNASFSEEGRQRVQNFCHIR